MQAGRGGGLAGLRAGRPAEFPVHPQASELDREQSSTKGHGTQLLTLAIHRFGRDDAAHRLSQQVDRHHPHSQHRGQRAQHLPARRHTQGDGGALSRRHASWQATHAHLVSANKPKVRPACPHALRARQHLRNSGAAGEGAPRMLSERAAGQRQNRPRTSTRWYPKEKWRGAARLDQAAASAATKKPVESDSRCAASARMASECAHSPPATSTAIKASASTRAATRRRCTCRAPREEKGKKVQPLDDDTKVDYFFQVRSQGSLGS